MEDDEIVANAQQKIRVMMRVKRKRLRRLIQSHLVKFSMLWTFHCSGLSLKALTRPIFSL
jgi:hypothetical protein